MVRHERNQSDMAGTLDCYPERSLVLGTNAGSATGFDFCPV
jgi:hypothetical protein